MEYIKLIRAKHWIKNFLIFLPLICGGSLSDKVLFWITCEGMLAFCLLSSTIYIINDIVDRDKDRVHPKKKNRPIASGKISVKKALLIAGILMLLSFVLNFAAVRGNLVGWIPFLGYLVINLLYSVGGMKKIPLLDVAFLAVGFILRVYYGSTISDIPISGWLYLVIISGAFYLGFGKRRNELKKMGDNSRDVLKRYSMEFLDKNQNCCMTLSIVFYSLWCVERNAVLNATGLLMTVPLLMMIFFKYSYNLDGESDGDPVDVILQDKILIALCAIFILWIIFTIY